MKLAKHNNSAITGGCHCSHPGTVFAGIMGAVFEITVTLVMALGLLSGCVLPADINERPPADMDDDGDGTGFIYQTDIVSTTPSTGVIVVKSDCRQATFRIILAELPDDEDVTRKFSFEIRWYLDYYRDKSVEASSPLKDGQKEYQLTIDPLALSADVESRYLEVYVSDLGFEASDVGEKDRTPVSGASTDQRSWLIQFSEETGYCDTEDTEEIQTLRLRD